MFELLFRYPRQIYSKGEIVFLGTWPVWLLWVLVLAGAAGLGWLIRSRLPEAAETVRGWRSAAIWLLQSTLLAVILILLWQPAILVSTLKPQQNVVAVIVDDSQSMAIADEGGARLDRAKSLLKSGVLDRLGKKFQLWLFRAGDHAVRVKEFDTAAPKATASNIGESLKEVSAETSGLPLGAIVFLSDGADNSGGLDLDTISELRSRRIPIHTVGFGKEKATKDVEIADVQLPARALADSRLAAAVSFSQYGFTGRKVKLSVRDGAKLLAAREVTLGVEGNIQTETLLFNAGNAGARALRFSLDELDGEDNRKNNAVSRLVNVENAKPRILYIEGEPRWEFKFIRRALDEDKSVRIVSMLRTTQNKIYRQGIDNQKELEDGFPAKVEELFNYQGLIIGSVDFGYFTTAQQELIKQFVDRRGGGLLMLGGRYALSEGGYTRSSFAEMLPVTLPDRRGTFHREPANVILTPAGAESLITRLAEDPKKNEETWQKLPYLADYQEIGTPKPGAAVLVEANPGGRGRIPMLVTQNYGRGRVAVFGTSGSWRWQMIPPLEDQTHEMFWQQLLRWLVQSTPGRVIVSTPRQMIFDDSKIQLNAEVRDRTFLPSADAKLEARIVGPEGISAQVELSPDPTNPGQYHAVYNAEKAGAYIAEIVAKRGEEELGRDAVPFQRQDGVAENFRTGQNRELLEKLASQTGGRYWKASDLSRLPEEISFSEAGISVRESHDLWNLPAVFLLIVGLRGTEWLLRRKWGIV